jgi:hypothetical protein
MQCREALSLVSDAMDREPVDPDSLAEAREHCRTCPECTEFVRAQLTVRAAPLPSYPLDLVDRSLARVRAEAALSSKTHAEATPTETTQDSTAPEFPTVSLARRPKREIKLPRPWAVGAAVLAALAALLLTGTIIVLGIRLMSGGASHNDEQGVRSYVYTPGQRSQATAGSTQDSSKGPRFIVVSGFVFSESGTGNPEGKQTQIGTTTSSLGGGRATQRTVYAGSAENTVYVADDSKTMHVFTLVTRSYLGQIYALTANNLTDFGQWPDLPSQLQKPTSSDGSPTFTRVGEDSNGVGVFARAGSSAIEGIAIAPSTDVGLMQGEPNWTWWTPPR